MEIAIPFFVIVFIWHVVAELKNKRSKSSYIATKVNQKDIPKIYTTSKNKPYKHKNTLIRILKDKGLYEKYKVAKVDYGWVGVLKGVCINKTRPELIEENLNIYNFLDRNFDLFEIDSELFSTNINNINDQSRQKNINKKMRDILKKNGMHDNDIDMYIVCGTSSTEQYVLDHFLNETIKYNCEKKRTLKV